MRILILCLLACAMFGADGLGPPPSSASGAPSGAAGGGLTGTYPNPTVATNANLTGPITSVGNATALAAQTGTGSVFVTQASPTLTTPNLGTPTAGVLTSCTGTAAGLTAGNVTTDANLTGPITSVGNATALAAQTGTGSVFVVQNTPTLTTPNIGAATGTSVVLSGSITDNGLTATRVTYAGTAGLLSDDQYCTRTTGGTQGTGFTTFGNTTASTTAGTGAIVDLGGLGVAGAAFVTGAVTTAGGVNSTLVTDATSGATGGVFTAGGVGATKAVWAGTNITAANGVFSDTIDDAVTNTNTAMATFVHTTSGTAANGFGTQQLFNLEDDGGTSRNAGAIAIQWTTAATATRSSSIVFQTISSAAALATQFSVGATGCTVAGTLSAVGGTFTGTNSLIVTQSAVTSVIRTTVNITPSNATTVTTGTESPQFKFNAHTMQWATTTPATQREVLIDQPTYSCNAVSQTITTAATLDIVGAPIASTNVTITNKDALRIEAGWLEMVGTTGNSLRITTATANATTACVFTAASGPSGAQTAIQGWLLLNVAGTDRFIPFW